MPQTFIDYEHVFYRNPTPQHPNKTSVKTSTAFATFAPQVAAGTDFVGTLAKIEALTKSHGASYDVTVSGNAFNNVRGTWYEWLAIRPLWAGIRAESGGALAIFPLPNRARFDLPMIFGDEGRELTKVLIEELRERDITLESSNPDAIVVRVPPQLNSGLPPTVTFDELAGGKMKDWLLACVEEMGWKDLRAVVSLKSSLRPDRRHQSVLEANRVKALHHHLRQRTWTRVAPLYAYTFAARFNDEDVAAAKTALILSLASIDVEPRRSTDALLPMNSLADAEAAAKLVVLNETQGK